MSRTAEEFTRTTQPLRRELLAYCYRMLGSLDDAEDLVQETYLRAWRSYGSFEGRSSVRTWLYRIATNACLTAVGRPARRFLPSGLPGRDDPIAVDWLQPVPDALVAPDPADPAAVVAFRDTVRLALVASLQVLPARQRAVLILRDVLDWPAARVAEALGTSTAAVKSSLQRARGRLEQARPTVDEVSLPDERGVRDLLDRYIDAFERADPSMLELLLSDDATLEVTPSLTRSAGKVACLRVIRDAVGAPGDWRLVPTCANGQPAAVAYRRDGSGVLRPFGVAVLAVTSTHITGIVVFNEPALVARFEPVV